ncbi:hypothetical protein M569_08267 [Genlisea aurea]|uniref:CBF1-interacting co-repressor CIR N-terminal domain-containing protein n=1 Tax=Genlisea aurea TaxID=192259 RepID=S8CHR2_9LAMI|nr:hypothetical protein M569_08267 [Genlisea aurea]
MALKFLNKKGWHTGSLRNIENVWKAEQKHDAEQKKLEELKKQIHEERERAEYRQMLEESGVISKQERLEFLYDSGLAVGKSSSGFKSLESLPKSDPEPVASSSAPGKPTAPGALFEDKPISSNDAWRKLHSDPLLLMRQKEQEALARIKNNPVKMAMIRQCVEVGDGKDKDDRRKSKKQGRNSEPDSKRPSRRSEALPRDDDHHRSRHHEKRDDHESRRSDHRSRRKPPLSEEERAAKLREMQVDAELHEEQRWKRLKRAAEDDAEEAVRDRHSSGRNFLDATQKSVYGAEERGGRTSTIEESVRRRTHYSQGRSAGDGNAFRR